MRSRAIGWFKRVLTGGGDQCLVSSVGGAHVASTAQVFAGSVRAVPSSIDERLAIVEDDLRQLRKEFKDETRKVRSEISAVSANVATETQSRKDGEARVQYLLEETAVGGLHLEWLGLGWLALAAIGTAIPQELAAFWDWLR